MRYKLGEIDGVITSRFENGMVEVDYGGTSLELLESDNELLGLEESQQLSDDQRQRIIQWVIANNVTVLIAFSGGKDSVAMVLRCLEWGIPREQMELWHHDVDGGGEQLYDWPCTPSYCQAFADAFGIKILYSYSEGGIVREIYRKDELRQPIFFQQEPGGPYTKIMPVFQERYVKTRHKFPAVNGDLNSRWCSSTVKIEVFNRAVNNSPRFKQAKILVLTGERWSESRVREGYWELEKYKSNTATRMAWLWRCVIDLKCSSDHKFDPATDSDGVWPLLRKWKVQPHPCYMLGWNRCSCQLCIFSNPNTWASIREISPEKVSRIGEIEQDINFTLYDGITIQQRCDKGTSFIKPDMKRRWLPELLGDFKSPIFIENWTLPQGALSHEISGPS